MVAPDQTSFDDSSQSGRVWDSVFEDRRCDEGGELSCAKGFDTSSPYLAGKSENCVDFGLSASDQSVSPMTETVADDSVSTESAASSVDFSHETVEEEGIKGDDMEKFENFLSVDVEIKEVVDEKLISKMEIAERESEVEEVQDGLESDDGIIKEEKSFVSGKFDDVVEDEIVGVDVSEETKEMIFGSSKSVEHFLEELEKVSSGIDANSDETNIPSHHIDHQMDGQIVTDSDEEADTNDEDEEKTFDTAAAPCLFPNRKVATGEEESESNLSEEEKEKLEKLQSLRVKFLRLLHRFKQSAEDSIAEQVLYRIALLAGRKTGKLFSLDAAKKMAMESEAAEGKEDLDFSLNILVLGKSGVGKSATINSIFGDQKSSINAFGPSTTSVREISGTMGGVKITIIDTPGLNSSPTYQRANSKILSSVKKVMNKYPPDVVLYVDRLGAQNRELENLPLLKKITASLGPSIWKNAILTLTHSASAPPDDPSGTSMSYEVFVTHCSYILQRSIAQAVGLMYSSPLMPVSLAENHSLCRKNRAGEKVLPNGQAWKPELLLLCYSLKVLSDAVSLFKPQEEPLNNRNSLASRIRSLPLSSILSLPNLLSSLLSSRAHLKLHADQGVDSDIELDDVSDSEKEEGEEEEDDEYDQLPPFKPLQKTQLAKLSKEHRKAYFDEYDYRVKLLQKKQWSEELRRMREMKKEGKNIVSEEEEEAPPPPASPPDLDMVLPTSFDSDDTAYRYRSLKPTSQFRTRSLMELNGWDNDCGFDCVIAEYSQAIAKRFPAEVFVNMTKDKKEFSINLNSSVCAKHGDYGSTMAGLNIKDVYEKLMYVVKGETRFKNLRKNKTTFGGSATFFNGNVATCYKLEDQITLGKILVLYGNAGTLRSREESAYETNVEVRIREADFPIGQNQYALGMSMTKPSKGEDLTLRGNLRSQVSVGRETKVAAFASLDKTMNGQFTVRTSSSGQLQVAVIGFMAIVPIAKYIYKRIIRSEEGESQVLYVANKDL